MAPRCSRQLLQRSTSAGSRVSAPTFEKRTTLSSPTAKSRRPSGVKASASQVPVRPPVSRTSSGYWRSRRSAWAGAAAAQPATAAKTSRHRSVATRMPRPPREPIRIYENGRGSGQPGSDGELGGEGADVLHGPPDAPVVGAELVGDFLGGVTLEAQLQDLPVLRRQEAEEVLQLVEEGDGRLGRRLEVEALQDAALEGRVGVGLGGGVALGGPVEGDPAQRLAHRDADEELADVVVGHRYLAVLDAVEEAAEDGLDDVLGIE